MIKLSKSHQIGQSIEQKEPYPPENYHDNGKSTIWRCISYWTWAFSNVMLVFRGVYLRNNISLIKIDKGPQAN